MSYTIADQDFELKECAKCGIRFLMPAIFDSECQKEGPNKTWYCPNGHGRVYREAEADQVRRELNIAKQQAARLSHDRLMAERRAETAEKETRRLKKRIGKGVCPCCNSTFDNVAKHMATKHPDIAVLKPKATA